MIKIKSFTLIEVTIATLIFMMVAIMATVSFGMVRRANDRAATLKNAGECREILQNYIKSEVKNAIPNNGVLGIKEVSHIATSIPVTNSIPASLVQNQFVGVVLVQENGTSKLIYKSETNYHYYYKELATSPASGSFVSLDSGLELLKDGTEIKCQGSPEDSYRLPFTIFSIKQNGGEETPILVKEQDRVYAVYTDAQPTSADQSFAYSSVSVVNGEAGI